jgi:hypothetical protein
MADWKNKLFFGDNLGHGSVVKAGRNGRWLICAILALTCSFGRVPKRH